MQRLIAVGMLLGWIGTALHADDSHIRLNSLGYLPHHPKRATVAAATTEFTVVRTADGKPILSGEVAEAKQSADTKETITFADFSAVTEPGAYVLRVPGVGKSPPFRIASDLYHAPFRTVTRGMYLWRCGSAVSGEHDGHTFAHALCHADDAFLDFVTGRHERKPSTGGWHDAGDYNKYVVNAAVTVGCMFRAWEDFGASIRKIKLDLPEAGGKLPEFLAEIKWELDWVLTMQAPDGSVHHKLSTEKFGGMILPERENATRYLTPWSTAATADFVAMTAAASRHFRPYDAAYADRCLGAARRSYEFLEDHPADIRADLKGFGTGTYQTRDPDDRLYAAAELWEATGDAEVLRDLESRIKSIEGKFEANFDWSNIGNLGLITYLHSKRDGRDESLVKRVRDGLLATADGIVRTASAHPYRRPLGDRYYWGCNGGVARQTLILYAAHRVEPKPAYLHAALDAVNHVFGRNVHARSYVTGTGHNPPMNPHDRRSAGDDVKPPWPGYLVGGPHPRAADWKDEEGDYRTNEIAINWNGALIYALAIFLDPADGQ